MPNFDDRNNPQERLPAEGLSELLGLRHTLQEDKALELRRENAIFEAIIAQVQESIGAPLSMTLPAVKDLCSLIKDAVEIKLTEIVIEDSNIENWAIASEHRVLAPGEQKEPEATALSFMYEWEIDYAKMIRHYLIAPQDGSFNLAMQMISNDQIELKNSSDYFKIQFIMALLGGLGDSAFLTDPHDNEKITRNMSIRGFAEFIKTGGYNGDFSLDPYEGSLLNHFREDLGLPEGVPLIAIHEAMLGEKVAQLERKKRCLNSCNIDPSSSISQEDRRRLYDFNQLYKDALREGTLDDPETRRDIALATTMSLLEQGPAVQESLDIINSEIKKRTEKLEKLRAGEAPAVVQDNEEKLLNRDKYLKQVICENRKWLEDFLAS